MNPGTRKSTEKPDKRVLAAPVYEAIKDRIMDQVFPPGSRLNIDALAAELQVSPTPVREALARLAAERLITFESFKGYSVSPPLSSHQIADLMSVRRILEVEAARRAAVRILLPDLMTLDKVLKEMETRSTGSWTHGYRTFNQLDQRFHETLLRAAGNPFLLDAHRALNIHAQLGRFYIDFTDNDQGDTCAEHNAIYQALSEHDSQTAANAVDKHLRATEIRVFDLIEKEAQHNGSW